MGRHVTTKSHAKHSMQNALVITVKFAQIYLTRLGGLFIGTLEFQFDGTVVVVVVVVVAVALLSNRWQVILGGILALRATFRQGPPQRNPAQTPSKCP